MIRQVLLFARGSQGERMPLLLGPLVKEIVKVLRETFPKSIQIVSAVDGEVWQVLGDATQLHQVLINLALNARDAMAFGGKLTIGIENRILDEEGVREHLGARIGRYVVITVADNGEGIAPENLARVFEPFFTTKEQGKGTGLGLSTVQGIIQGHEGFIDLQSEPGEGTVFSIFLPALVDSKSAESQRSYSIIPSGHGELILVVDDEESILEITKGALESFGYRVLTAGDGVEAIGTYAMRKDEISAVITDLMMPVMDGPATIRALLKLNPLAKIIACSGVMADANIHEATRAGAKLFLPKPFTTEKLLKAVKEILG
jgi:two-component system cell cycle sensor histidine kinase/response regulator CckA